MKLRFLVLTLILLVTAHSILAANIHGSVYDLSLKEVKNVIVEINTEPAQKVLAKEGIYEFEVAPGKYVLTVMIPNQEGIIEQENITIKDNGNYTLDLFVTEEIPFNEIIDATKKNYTEELSTTPSSPSFYLLTFATIFLIGIIILGIWYILKQENKKEPEEIVSTNDLDKIISIIKKENGRISQKELRKHFPLSEAKISLMITELEHKNKIEKIKKGRTNILILKQ